MSAIATTITTRATGTNGVNGVTVKNNPLSNAEIDNNFINLNANKLELGDTTAANTASAVVRRDASGNFAAGTITAALNGNANTATTLQTTRKINNVDFNGSADIVTTTTYDGGFFRITNPGGGYWSHGNSVVTGALAITLPVGATNTMVQIKVKVYEYNTNRSFELCVGGYTYTGNTWANNPFAYIVGTPNTDRRFNVRLGYTSGGKMIVYIGETTSTWSYPQVFVTEVLCGYGGQQAAWLNGWTVGSATTHENVTATIASSDIQVGWKAQDLNTANTYQVNSLGVGTAGSGTAGEIRATNAITSYYSDERLKENITPITDALSKVMQLSGVTYNANEIAESYGFTDKSKQVGVLAQQVEKVLPEAVKHAPFDIMLFENTEMSRSGENYKTVQYEKIVPLLIEAIKELQQEVVELKGSK